MHHRTAARTLALSVALGIALAVAAVLIGAAAPADPPTAPDPHIDALLDRVTTTTLMADLAALSGETPVTIAGSPYTIATRNTHRGEAISMTTRYAFEQLSGCGLDVAFHAYTSGEFDGPRRNVVAQKLGRVVPDEIYLLTAHIDSLPEGDLAPGADDNGSGSVAVMRAGCLLAPGHFAHTLRFVLFTGEEQGLKGSRAYAADCAAQGETIAGVVNLDMIGYNTGEPTFDAYAWSSSTAPGVGSRDLADQFASLVTAYGLDLSPARIDEDNFPIRHSDQWSFLENGYPGILVIEGIDAGDFNPHYHQTSDTVAFIEPDYFAELTKASVAAAAHLGQRLSTGVVSATVHLSAGGPLPPVTVTAESDLYVGSFPLTAGLVDGFTSTLPVGTYTVTVEPAPPRYLPAVTRVNITTDTLTAIDIVLPSQTRIYLPQVCRSSIPTP